MAPKQTPPAGAPDSAANGDTTKTTQPASQAQIAANAQAEADAKAAGEAKAAADARAASDAKLAEDAKAAAAKAKASDPAKGKTDPLATMAPTADEVVADLQERLDEHDPIIARVAQFAEQHANVEQPQRLDDERAKYCTEAMLAENALIGELRGHITTLGHVLKTRVNRVSMASEHLAKITKPAKERLHEIKLQQEAKRRAGKLKVPTPPQTVVVQQAPAVQPTLQNMGIIKGQQPAPPLS